MSIILEKGDLFAVEADVIGHGTNCVGAMGAGIAKAFAAKFPIMYAQYRRDCVLGKYVPGDFMTFYENDVHGVNLFSQDQTGADARYEAIATSVIGVSQRLSRTYLTDSDGSHRNTVLAIPLIGCGIGGLKFNDLYWAVYNAASLFSNIDYKIVYNDDNEHMIPERMR